MFYLIEVLKQFKRTPLSGMFSMLLLIILLTLISSFNFFEGKILKATGEKKLGPYFHVLIDTTIENGRLLPKLFELPGIAEIKTISQEEISKQVKAMFENLDLTLSEDELNLNYAGYKITFDEATDQRSKDLIRDYIVKLIGKEHLIMGSISVPSVGTQSKTLIDKYKKFFFPTVLLVLTIITLLSYLIYCRALFQYSNLLEKYQRKSSVFIKVLFANKILALCLSIPLSFYIGSLEPLMITAGAVTILIMGLVEERIIKWQR